MYIKVVEVGLLEVEADALLTEFLSWKVCYEFAGDFVQEFCGWVPSHFLGVS